MFLFLNLTRKPQMWAHAREANIFGNARLCEVGIFEDEGKNWMQIEVAKTLISRLAQEKADN